MKLEKIISKDVFNKNDIIEEEKFGVFSFLGELGLTSIDLYSVQSYEYRLSFNFGNICINKLEYYKCSHTWIYALENIHYVLYLQEIEDYSWIKYNSLLIEEYLLMFKIELENQRNIKLLSSIKDFDTHSIL